MLRYKTMKAPRLSEIVGNYRPGKLSITVLLLIYCFSIPVSGANQLTRVVSPMTYGAKGDGMHDDSDAVQKALTACSNRFWVKCVLPSDKAFLVTKPLFAWGKATIEGESAQHKGKILFDATGLKYLINFGLSAPGVKQPPFSGIVQNIAFKVIRGDQLGRILFFWRSENAHIINNLFDVGVHSYAATGSGNDVAWLPVERHAYLRSNIFVTGNLMQAESGPKGFEGISFNLFDGVNVADNHILGVGDDPIGIHFCKNVSITNNTLSSVDGRLLVVNSENVSIKGNYIARVPSPQTKTFHQGISLLYIGYESLKVGQLQPTNYTVKNNHLSYPPGAIDSDGAIYVYAPNRVRMVANTIENNSSMVKAAGLYLLPARLKNPKTNTFEAIEPVGDFTFANNQSTGKFPLKFKLTGNCNDFNGIIEFVDNRGFGALDRCNIRSIQQSAFDQENPPTLPNSEAIR